MRIVGTLKEALINLNWYQKKPFPSFILWSNFVFINVTGFHLISFVLVSQFIHQSYHYHWCKCWVFTTVANFNPEHSGTEKDQRGYPLCLKSEILSLLLKVLIREISLLERIFISRFSSVMLYQRVNAN